MKKYILNPRKVFFGWWMTLASGLLCLWGYAFGAYGFSALFKPISQELGFSRTATSFAASITRFEGGLEAPLVGWLSDKYGPKVVMFFGIFIAGLGLVLMYWVNSLLSFYFIWALVFSTGINISLGMPIDVAITNWFVKKRGTAIGIRWVFSGLSGTIGLPLVAWMIVSFGWRMTCMIGGLVTWFVGLPLVLIFVKSRRPEYYGLLPDGAVSESNANDKAGMRYAAETGEIEMTAKQAMKTHAFWLIIIAYMFHGALYPVMNIHCIPFLTDKGIDPVKAAFVMTLFITSSIPARFIGGFIVDKVNINRMRFLLAGAMLMQCFGVTLFLLNQQNMTVLYAFFIIYGLGMGATMPITPVMRARYFGRKHFGIISGISNFLNMPVAIIGPVAAGWIFDVTKSYEIAFILFAVLLGVASLTMAMASPPRSPGQAVKSA